MPKLGSWSLLKTEIQKPSFNAAGLDFDVLKASAIAYINANTFVQKRMLVRWGVAFPTEICLVCKGEGYDKENSSL